MLKKTSFVSLVLSLFMTLIPSVTFAAEDWNPTLYQSWGNEASTLIEQDFRIRSYDGYYEDQNKSAWAFCWPNSVNIMAIAAAAKMNPNMYTDRLNNYITSMDIHWTFVNGKYGYDAVGNPSMTNRFYDDNSWMAWALADSYAADGIPAHLQKAKDAYAFALSGEDSVQGGGIYWKETQYSGDPVKMKAVSATAGTALSAAKLYALTNTAAYKNDAVRLLGWIWNNLRDSTTGLINNSVDINGVMDTTKWAYNTGVPMYAYAVLYSKTGNASDLNKAIGLGNAAESYFYNATTGAITDGSYFAFTLLEGWLELYRQTGNVHWRDLAAKALAYVHAHRDPNGRYPERWDANPTSALSVYKLLHTAPAARAYWRAAEIEGFPISMPSFVPAANITVTASSTWSGLSPANTVDGSGLTGYLHDNNSTAATMWHSLAGGGGSGNPNPGTIAGAAWLRYSFTQTYNLGRLWIWNHNQYLVSNRGLRSVTVQYTANGTTWSTLGTYEFAEAAGTANYPHNIEIDFGGIAAKAVVITANSTNGNWGDSGPYFGLSEVRFGLAQAPAGNLAPSASVNCSTEFSSDYTAAKAVDGIVGLHGVGEWASNETNPWIQLTWSSSKTISKVVMMDRINLSDAAKGGTLTFSNGSSIAVSGIANDGTPKEIMFPAKTVTWVKFQVSGGSGAHVGLSEISVY